MDSSPTTIKAPDTATARQFVELRTAQQERQRRIQALLFSPPTSAAFISAASPNRTFNYSSPNPSNESDQSSGSAAEQDTDQIIIPCKLEFEFAKDITPSGASIFNSLTLDNMIAGSAGAATYSSQEIYSSLISMAAVPKAVADLKTVKVACSCTSLHLKVADKYFDRQNQGLRPFRQPSAVCRAAAQRCCPDRVSHSGSS